MKQLLTIVIFLPLFGFSQQLEEWNFSIKNDLEEWIPLRIYFHISTPDDRSIVIKNAEEKIHLSPYKIVEDTAFYRFLDYNAELALIKKDAFNYDGYWVNFENEPVKKRSVKATVKAEGYDRNENHIPYNLNGNWKSSITRKSNSSVAILMIQQQKDILYATIRTNAGDYRFLEGKVYENSFWLSSFSGNSVYYLKGTVINDTIKARLSGLKTNDIYIEGVKDSLYELPDGKTLTKVINNQTFQLNLKNELNQPVDFFKSIANKVAIVSIFGTWCPNCVDEVNYFNELQEKFPSLEIICVAFENSENEVERQKRIQGFKQRKNISIPFLIAGKPSTENIFFHFPMIDKFGGYPTSFLLDKSGKIVEIYTGFNGPATGTYYDLFKEELEEKIRSLSK